MFFKLNKEIRTEDLKLSDYDKIWTKFCFLDGFRNRNFNIFVDKTDGTTIKDDDN